MATSEIEKFATLIMEEIQDFRTDVNTRFNEVDKKFEQIDTKFDKIDARFDRMDARFDQMDIRFDHIESELSFINKRLDALEEQGASNAGFAKEIDDLRTRVKIMEAKLAKA